MIVIYTTKVTNRLRFILDFVFHQYFGITYQIVFNKDDFITSSQYKVNYSNSIIQDVFNIPQYTLLLEDEIQQQLLLISKQDNLPTLFPIDDSHFNLSFDIFSSIFYLITRYEEYLPHQQDEHGRYLSSNSILSQPDFNFQPIVEMWLLNFKDKLRKRYPEIKFKDLFFNKTYTFDIDNAFQYKARNWLQKPPNIFSIDVLKTLLNYKQDNYNTFTLISNFIKNNKEKTYIFFLLSNINNYNSNVNPNSSKLHNIIKQFKNYNIGTHSSYSFIDNNFIFEKQLLEKIINKKIIFNRQHYLKISFPNYFNTINKYKIKIDFSLGYPNITGCRAGTTQAFHFFDLTKNEQRSLLIQPFNFMDATYQYYIKTTDTNIANIVEKELEKIKKINGNFVSIFHNDLLQDYFYYKKILYKIYEY